MQQRTGNVDAPALAAGELAKRPVEQLLKVQKPGQLRKPRFEVPAGDAIKRGAASEVVPDGQRPVQHGVLENDAQTAGDVLHAPVHALAADAHAAAVLGKLAAQNGDGRGLARAVDAEEGKQLARPDVEGQVLHGVYFPKTFIQTFNFNDMFHMLPFYLRRSGD